MTRVVCIAIGPVCLWLALNLLGLDRFTTVSVGRMSALIVGIWALVVFCLTLHAYVNDSEPTDAIAKAKRDSRGAWIAAGILGALTLSALSTFGMGRLVRTAAQYFPGAEREVSGEITDVMAYGARGTCTVNATVAISPTDETVKFCVDVNVRAAIGPMDLEPGQRISLHLKDTALGTVALGFEREWHRHRQSDPAPAPDR